MMMLLLSAAALACPVCGGGGQNQQAFVDTMIFMSLLPLAMIGGVVFTFWKLSAQLDDDASQTTPAEPQR